MNILIVIDMQNDFIDGALGTPEAVAIVPAVVDKIQNFDGPVLYTRDTHGEDYLQTQEGENLPVPHCIKDSDGWQLQKDIRALAEEADATIIDKPSFGSAELPKVVAELAEKEPIESITIVGLCTDICVISNAMILKAFMPEVPVIIDASCCAGVTPESHRNALEAMQVCQMKIENYAG